MLTMDDSSRSRSTLRLVVSLREGLLCERSARGVTRDGSKPRYWLGDFYEWLRLRQL